MFRIVLVIVVTLFWSAITAQAAESPGRVCSLNKGFECTSGEGCREWSMIEMGLPRFVMINLDTKNITSLDKDVPRPPTLIATIDRLDGMTVLHGNEMRGWIIALGDESGALTLSVAGEDGGLIVFGYCISP